MGEIEARLPDHPKVEEASFYLTVAKTLLTDLNEKVVRINELEKFILSMRLRHYECEDCFFSCPKSGDCCNHTIDQNTCICGADTINNEIDEILGL